MEKVGNVALKEQRSQQPRQLKLASCYFSVSPNYPHGQDRRINRCSSTGEYLDIGV